MSHYRISEQLLTELVDQMSQLTEAMTAALAQLKKQGGATDAQVVAAVHSVVDPQITDLNTQIAAILAKETDDATKVADVTAALNEFTTAFAPATVPAALTVTGVVPNTGATGVSVVISGTGFTGATAVNFNKVAATSFSVVNDTTINAVVPAGTGVPDVLVTTPAGTSAIVAADQFTFTA